MYTSFPTDLVLRQGFYLIADSFGEQMGEALYGHQISEIVFNGLLFLPSADMVVRVAASGEQNN
jgi:hypothetical protein